MALELNFFAGYSLKGDGAPIDAGESPDITRSIVME